MIERYQVREMAENIWSDNARFTRWMEIELTVMEVMEEQGMIPPGTASTARSGAGFNIRNILEIEKDVNHDVIAFLTDLGNNVGRDASRYLHLGLTSSDIIDTALGMQLRDASRLIMSKLKQFRQVLGKQAKSYKNTVMVGRTHGIHAEPITLGLKIAVWYSETGRHLKRLDAAARSVSVGKISGAVGTYAHLSPVIEEMVCKRLGLRPEPVSTQVVQRDRHAHYLSVLAGIGASLEKIAIEIRSLQRTEIGELMEHFGTRQKGSSAMPHKRNPITCERVSGMARILRANAHAAMENVALWNERDISHSSVERVILPDSTQLIYYMLDKMTNILENLNVDKSALAKNLELTGGLIFSQGILLALIRKGMDRLVAYRLVQGVASRAWDSRKNFIEELSGDREIRKWMDESEIKVLVSTDQYLRWVDRIYERIGLS